MSNICNEAIDWVLRNIDHRVFKALMKDSLRFRMLVGKGGFKIQKDNFRHNRVRNHLTTIIGRDGDQAQYLFTEGLANVSKMKGVQEAYQQLPGDWLKQNWSQWFRTLKDARPWAYALFCDSDQPWAHRLGGHLLAWPAFWKTWPLPMRPERGIKVSLPELPTETAGCWALESRSEKMSPEVAEPSQMAEEMVPLVSEVPSGLEPLKTTPTSSAADMGDVGRKRLGEVIQERDKLNKRVKVLEELHAKDLMAKDEEIQELKQRLAECDRNFAGAVEELREYQQQTTEAQMAAFEATVLGVHPDLVAFAAQAVREGSGLRERVSLMLKQQQKANKCYGTLQSIRDELHKTDQMLTQVKLAVEDAIQPIAGMTELQRDLESRIAKLKQKLGEEARNETMVLPARLKAYIVEIPFDANALSKYSEVRKMLESDLGKNLYGPEERTEALEILERRRKMAMDALARTAKVPQTMVNESVTGPLLEIFQLHKFLDHAPEVDLFVDAYNVIKHDSHWAGIETTVGGFTAARADFIDKCLHVARNFRSMTLVFDSDLPTATVDKKKNVTIVYTAQKTEGQNADNELVERMTKMAAADEESGEENLRWLVTNDMGLRMRVCNVCNAVVDVFAFANFLKQ